MMVKLGNRGVDCCYGSEGDFALMVMKVEIIVSRAEMIGSKDFSGFRNFLMPSRLNTTGTRRTFKAYVTKL